MNTKTIGEIAEAQVLAALLKTGYTILLPFGENQRYDLVIESNGQFERVQCKNGRLKNGAVAFQTSSASGHAARKDYRGAADLFGVYCKGTEKVYLVPVDKTTVTEGRLRVAAPKNNQTKGVVWAKKYEVGL